MSDQVTQKCIDLALQGGGSHGALTWGVLDRLLEDDRIRICSISGTSAGAMNAVVLANGLEKGGAEGGRDALAAFWKAVADDMGPHVQQFQPRLLPGLSLV
jgi:NTE family protein